MSLAGLRGKVVVLAPFLSLCQDECPLVTGAFISLQRDLRAAGQAHRVVFVEATVDPGRDTVARLAAYEKEFGADWDLWTGTPAQIASFWKPFGVEYQKVPEEQPPKDDWWTGQPLTYDVEHTDGYILINRLGPRALRRRDGAEHGGPAQPEADVAARRRRRPRPRPSPRTELDHRRCTVVHQLAARHHRPRRGIVRRATLRRTAPVVPAALAALALILSACGNSGITTLSAPPTTNPSLTLTLQRSPEGPILATGGGDTLYDFVPDTPTHSACLNDGCVLQWPPLLKSGPVTVGTGVDSSLVGTLLRPGGSTQLSYGGHPLYTYNLDVTPGMVTGQAIDQDGGLWYVLNAKGQQITTGFSVTSPNANG